MPRRMMYDGRYPYGSRGGYVVSSRGRGRRDRAMMDYDDDMARGGRGGRGRGMADYGEHYMARNDDMRYRDYRGGDYGEDMRGGYDGHHPEAREYRPIEAMGVFNGYYGMGDHARTYRDYGYDDYGYDDYGDYGETLTEKELEKWNKKLMSHLDDREKQILIMRYGLGNTRAYTQREVAEKLAISRSYVSRIEKSSLEKINKYLSCEG